MPQSHDLKTPRGFSVLELMIAVSILLILAAIEVPNLLRARAAANQAAAVASLRAIEAAEITYAVTYNRGYTPTLSQLGPAHGAASPEAADLVDAFLANGAKNGYTYLYVPGPVVDGKIDSFTLKALPSTPCVTGSVSYSMGPSDQTSVTAENFSSVAANDFVAKILIGSVGNETVSCAQ